MFIGRKNEMTKLTTFKKRDVAGLAVIYGRRRIGKSTLIEHFAKDYQFLEFYGLSPRKCTSNEDQLSHFGAQMGRAFNVPAMKFDNWYDALTTLAGFSAKGEYLILLDEISWMATYDKNLPGIIKGIWDTRFKKNNQLLLFLCGSVSSWIEENILRDKGFVGRVSMQMRLEEMPLSDANLFWQGNPNISAAEKFKLLCVTGGIPRYLEEINIKETAEQNIKRLMYLPEGLLFNEFDTIFEDIFGKRNESYQAIVKALVNGSMEQSLLSEKLDRPQTGSLTSQLNALESAGFIKRDYISNLKTQKTNLSRYRLRDNYLRFYLKYLLPKKDLIAKNLYQNSDLENLPEWNSIMGLQFENLVLNNLIEVIKRLNICEETIISATPYFQKQTTRQKAAQFDLLIHTKYTLYVCEIKFRKNINSKVIEEMAEKISRLKVAKTLSIRPVLIYYGELSNTVIRSNYFSHLVSFSSLLGE